MDDLLNDEEELRIANRRKRLEEMRRSKEKQMMRRMYIKKYTPFVVGAFVILIFIFIGIKIFHAPSVKEPADKEDAESIEDIMGNESMENANQDKSMKDTDQENVLEDKGNIMAQVPGREGLPDSARENIPIYQAFTTEDTLKLGDTLKSGEDFNSEYAILIDLSDNNILAEKGYKEIIDPASMTKVLTVLVAAEHMENPEDLDDPFTITTDITDYGYIHGCSAAGFSKNETVTIRDLFYGTILPSGADAAVGLAVYIAGDQESFVEMMNEKLRELGLSKTSHFTNCVGVYDEKHYSTVYDIAMIMEAAAENELCREVLTAHTYITSKTEQHPKGIELSNWFLRRIEDKDSGGEVLYAKTGYVSQAGSCAASYLTDDEGNAYICVTGKAANQYRCIDDHARLYKQFLG